MTGIPYGGPVGAVSKPSPSEQVDASGYGRDGSSRRQKYSDCHDDWRLHHVIAGLESRSKRCWRTVSSGCLTYKPRKLT